MKTRALKILVATIVIVLFSAVIVTTALLSYRNKDDNNSSQGSSSNSSVEEIIPPESDDNGVDDDSQSGEPVVPELSTVDKVYLMIANADAEIYNKFAYFISLDGKIISEHVDLTNVSDEVESICTLLYGYVTGIFGSVDKITNEMYNSYDTIYNKVNELRELFGQNMKY